MSYALDSLNGTFVAVGGGSTEIDDLTSAAVHSQSYVALESCSVTQLMALVTTLVAADTAAPVIAFKHRPLYGSTTGETTIGSLTIPDTTGGK